MAYQLKPFVINLNDLSYLLQQINFKPMFDAQGNAVVNWDGVSAVFDANNNPYNLAGLTQEQAWTAYGHGFPSVAAPIGIRDVTGFHNNLFGTQAQWGNVDVPFVRSAPADYGNYITSPGANYTPGLGTGTSGSNVIDGAPRMISRTITTGGVNLLVDGAGHFVEWRAALYADPSAAGLAYKALVDGAGVDTAHLVEGTKIVAPLGMTLAWDATADNASIMYATLLTYIAGGAKLVGSDTGGPLVDGGGMWKFDGTTYTQLSGLTFDANLFLYHSLVAASGVATSTLAAGDAIALTPANVATAIAGLITLGDVAVDTANALLGAGSGYGLLETLGHIDYQNPTSGEFFIGSENPGVSPVNSWFAIFGQFFDHGLDKLGAGGNGKITIALDPSDPLYGVIGADGQPTTSITVTRATIAGTDANGDPTYINHTSPFIDQSQTYGSHAQLTNLLREWVSTDGGLTYHAGMELFDGTTLVDAWTRKMPVYDPNTGLTTMVETSVHETLPTLAELRAHLLATGRDDLSWSDVLDLRNRDASGDVITSGTGAGNSGSPLLLDMNPHFDAAHISAAALAELNLQSGAAFTATTLSYGALIGMGLINPSTNQVNANFPSYMGGGAISADLQKAVSEVLLQSVGDHYIAGDGRVNENFGLTSIHHVFHEEHNYQVENLKTWIYAHDANNPGAIDVHAGLHEWQINTGTQDAHGNYLNVDNSIAWDSNKMFEATKLIVEMEYQHAAVDQYARTITPRIQEFVGYSSGVDSTITLEYAQVAFRFGHSTIRETIDTIDPSGWFKGHVTTYALESAFLAPQTFAQEGVAAITLGLSRQQMSEVDEFITPALNQGLLGQPLDLAAINIARGRDMGIPTLNDFRAAISLARYTSWADFGANMIHPESLVNFIAAYSFGGLAAGVEKAAAIMGLFDGSIAEGSTAAMGFSAADAVAFMNNNAILDADLNTARDGFNHIDAWMGGLAEAHVPGGLLGETFDAVFVAQIQALMDGDRFYYLYRLFGTQIAEEVNNGQFKDLVERNTGLEHLNGSIFAYADKYYQFKDAAVSDSKNEHSYATELAANPTLGMYSDGGATTANNGSIITINGVDYIRDVRPELDPTQTHPVEGTPVSGADSHEVIVGTDRNDFIHARGGDDTVYGDGGDDILYGDGGIDRLYGGDGNDYIDTGEGPDLADGGAGKDSIYGRGSGSEVGGFDQLVGGSGNDLVVGGEGIDKLSSGSGDDIVFGDGLTNPEMGNTDPFTHAGDGNDYVDGGASGDLIYGEEGDDYIVGGADQDLMQGGQGDDIIRPGKPSQAIGGGPDEVVGDDGYTNKGFDLVDFSDYAAGGPGVTISLINQTNPLINIDGTTPIPAMSQIEGIIGSSNNDTLGGEIAIAALLPGDPAPTVNVENNWLIGGSGNDTMSGGAGNDLIIGGSVRLDTLIGKYADAANASGPGNLALGSQAWIDDAMRTGSAGYTGLNDGYDNDMQNAYTGSSNQATGALSGGLLAGVNTTIAGTANDFELHFTDMLKSRMFKDVVLGDGGADGAGDTAVFSGKYAQYSMAAFDINGAAVVDPHANWAQVYAIKITDNRTAADLLDAGGAPLLDANGDPITLDGIDIVVGVENFKFADQTINPAAYFDKAPVVDLRYQPVPSTLTVASDSFNGTGTSYTRGTGWNAGWTESDDVVTTVGATPQSSGQILDNNDSLRFSGGDGAAILRAVNLAGNASTTISYSVNEANFAVGETVVVQFAADGVNFITLETITSATNNAGTHSFTVNAPVGGFSTSAVLKMVANTAVAGANNAQHTVTFDNFVVTTPGPITDGAAGINNATTYTEAGAATAITTAARITDPDVGDTTIASAKIVISDAVAGDMLSFVSLPAGITATGNGTGLNGMTGATQVSLAGTATQAAYQTALAAITFANTTQDPTNHGSNPTRHINVTVNDGLKDSAVAMTTVTVTAVDNAATALAADSVITNYGSAANPGNQLNIVIPDWALVANDTDVDGAVILGVSNEIGLSNLAHNGGNVTVRDFTPNGGSFQYLSGVLSATVTVTQDTNGPLGGTNNAEIIIGNGGDTTINGLGGNDIILAGAGLDIVNAGDGNDIIYGGQDDDTINAGNGDDRIVWSAGNNGGDGTDVIDGGASTLVVGDRFVLNGTNSTETFRIISITDPNNAAEIDAILNAANGGNGYTLNPASDILILRNGTIVAELRNIEEITINTTDITANNGNGVVDGGAIGGDNVQIVGDFTGTSLKYSTITVNGSGQDDTVDISGLHSAHHVVFNAGGGSDTFIGQRSQDELYDYDDNVAPVITSNGGNATAEINIAENSTFVTTVIASDANAGTTLVYSISGADADYFVIDSATGELAFGAAPDFEGSNGNVYNITVTASDGVLTDTQDLVVNVTDVNEAAPVITSNEGGDTAAIHIAENGTFVTNVAATDEDANTTLTYTIGGADAANFLINAATGELVFNPAPDFESLAHGNIYNVTVTASDGALSDTQALTVTVTNVNEAPVITSTTTVFNVAENTTAVTTITATDVDAGAVLAYSIAGGADADKFVINAAGVLSFITSPNFEALADVGGNNVYDVIVQVSDGTLTDTQAIAVTVTNVNEAPVITSAAAISVAENTTAVGTVTATDVDAGTTLVYSISGTDAAKFNINAATGALSFINAPNFEAPTDAGANNVYDIIVGASDGAITTTQALAVTVTNVNTPNQTLNGNNAANTLTGGEGNDTISGLGGNDTLSGRDGNDNMSGGNGNDVMYGGTGNDNLNGGDGSDTLFGENGADILSGGNGVDVLYGGAGADSLNGGAGNDLLFGDAGNDNMNGGNGNDTFYLATGGGADIITGFDAIVLGGQDRLNLAGYGITAGNFASHVSIVDLGNDTRVTIDGADTITLLGVNGVGLNAITQADFSF
jgi:Ca2+-binding RTX toxin-like protein